MNPFLMYLLVKELGATKYNFDYKIPIVFKVLFIIVSAALLTLCTLFVIGFIKNVIIS